MKNFINPDIIYTHLEENSKPDKFFIRDILEQSKSIDHKSLSLKQTAALLQNKDPEIDKEIFSIAKEIKKRIYGNRMVLFAPLYVSNTCINNCAYCGFRTENKDLIRKTLNENELKEEVVAIEQMGHKRLLMVYGEGNHDAYWIADTIATAYSIKKPPSGEIRRININCAPTSVDNFKILKNAEIGTYQCFQETYHSPTYKKVHISGPKSDYLYRLYSMHRAMEAGIDDIGIGALFGLANYKFEVLALLSHCEKLERDFGVGPHTISFPRIEPAQGSELSHKPPHAVTDDELKRIIAITRLAVPYTGMILSTRESAKLRTELLEFGISQLSAASRVYPGSYKAEKINQEDTQQFTIADERSLDEVVFDMTKHGYIPSFCTGCYRKSRTGDHFMGLAKTNFIKNFCKPNAILTFAEYLRDYASDKTRQTGNNLIKNLIKEDDNLKNNISDSLSKIMNGENDIYF
ncbi:[FeFe] hydrogenase H-cluster radical SAM maturase HydG [Pseudomonadota bacterium]